MESWVILETKCPSTDLLLDKHQWCHSGLQVYILRFLLDETGNIYRDHVTYLHRGQETDAYYPTPRGNKNRFLWSSQACMNVKPCRCAAISISQHPRWENFEGLNPDGTEDGGSPAAAAIAPYSAGSYTIVDLDKSSPSQSNQR